MPIQIVMVGATCRQTCFTIRCCRGNAPVDVCRASRPTTAFFVRNARFEPLPPLVKNNALLQASELVCFLQFYVVVVVVVVVVISLV
jgi:hypothetical protein